MTRETGGWRRLRTRKAIRGAVDGLPDETTRSLTASVCLEEVLAQQRAIDTRHIRRAVRWSMLGAERGAVHTGRLVAGVVVGAGLHPGGFLVGVNRCSELTVSTAYPGRR